MGRKTEEIYTYVYSYDCSSTNRNGSITVKLESDNPDISCEAVIKAIECAKIDISMKVKNITAKAALS